MGLRYVAEIVTSCNRSPPQEIYLGRGRWAGPDNKRQRDGVREWAVMEGPFKGYAWDFWQLVVA